MHILELGDNIFIRDIVFEDDKYDEEAGHPGIVIVPSNEVDDYAYCVYMTTDVTRYKRENDKYLEYEGIFKKSYINLRQIIKVPNRFTHVYKRASDKKCAELLQKIYDYQTQNGETEEFNEIKDKVEIIIALFEAKKSSRHVEINDENIKMLSGMPKENWPILIYTKYMGKMNPRAGQEQQAQQINKVKTKLEDYVKKYQKDDGSNTREFYNDLKLFNRTDLENTLKYSIALIKGNIKYNKYLSSLEQIETELEELKQEEKDLEEAINKECMDYEIARGRNGTNKKNIERRKSKYEEIETKDKRIVYHRKNRMNNKYEYDEWEIDE